MTQDTRAERELARKFRDAALPHLDAVYNYAVFLTRNEVDAQDAVQDCYLLALRHFRGFRGGSSKAWLLSILTNVCRTEFRRRGRREQAMDLSAQDGLAEKSIWQEPPETPEASLERHQEGRSIRQLVDTLPAPLREVVVLREFQDLSYKEIAEVCCMPVGTVMSRLARARERLLAARTTELHALA